MFLKNQLILTSFSLTSIKKYQGCEFPWRPWGMGIGWCHAGLCWVTQVYTKEKERNLCNSCLWEIIKSLGHLICMDGWVQKMGAIDIAILMVPVEWVITWSIVHSLGSRKASIRKHCDCCRPGEAWPMAWVGACCVCPEMALLELANLVFTSFPLW